MGILAGMWAGPAVLVAHHLKLTEQLGKNPRTLSEIYETMKIARRPAGTLLTLSTALALPRVANGC